MHSKIIGMQNLYIKEVQGYLNKGMNYNIRNRGWSIAWRLQLRVGCKSGRLQGEFCLGSVYLGHFSELSGIILLLKTSGSFRNGGTSLLLGLDFSSKQCVMVSQGCVDLVQAREMIQSGAWGQLQTPHYLSLVCISVSSGILLLKLCYTSCETISAVRERLGGGRERYDYVLLT